MRYGLGIDLGTTFTSAAISGPNGTQMMSLSQEMIVPSVAFPAPDGSVLTGPAALAATADPARVARNFKRRLGDPTPLVLGGSPYSPAVLMAAQLRDVVTTVTRTMGGRPESIVLTCPAIWGPYRREHFTEVPKIAGVTNHRLLTEPEAAATHYSNERRLGDGEVVAVYDLGGGTFDTTILRMRNGAMEILGTPEGIEHMGGIDFDEALLAHLDNRLDGAITALDADGSPTDRAALAAIRALCVRAKEDLSLEPDVRLTVPLPSGPREVTITRLEFNEMITPAVRQTTEALRRTITSAGLTADDVSAILLAGGSSRIPLVSQLVSREFGKPVRVTLHPKFTVALGAAAVAARPAPATTVTAPPAPPTATPPTPAAFAARPRRKWLVPAVAAAAAVVVGVAAVLLFNSRGDDTRSAGTGAPATTTSARSTAESTAEAAADGPAADLPPLQLYTADAVQPYHGFIGDAANWTGTEIVANGATLTSIAAATAGTSGMKVTWTGDAPGQVYLQTPNHPADLSTYVDAKGALVFDVVVHQPPDGAISMQAHCLYPCRAEVPATTLFQNLPADQPATVKIPLTCFTRAGLDPTKVDTPFLVYSDVRFSATFANIRWEEGAGTDADATSCADLK